VLCCAAIPSVQQRKLLLSIGIPCPVVSALCSNAKDPIEGRNLFIKELENLFSRE
jgi:hypothetical protein